ncbi:MAG: phosphoribosylanthranilate isomerase [Betaproteobacteria bacterium]
MRTRIKMCGFTRVADALFAANAGVDAIGMIFYQGSPRAIGIEGAREISRALPPFVSTVALFVNESAGNIASVVDAVRPSILQFHGDENENFCAQFGLPYLKAIRVGGEMTSGDLLKCEAAFHSAKALLLDTLSTAAFGGTGTLFDWTLIPVSMRERIVLSGGLTPENVEGAIVQLRPWAIDVASGIETAVKGIKDHSRITQFIEAVKNADAQ